MTEITKVNHINLINNKRKLIEDVYNCIKLLDRAIDMHQMHINYPETAIPISQKEMMGLMLGARNCTNNQLRLYEK